MKKIIISLIVLAVLAGAGYYLYKKNQAQAPAAPAVSQEANTNSEPLQQEQPVAATTAPAAVLNTNPSPDPATAHYSSGEGDVAAPDIQVWEIDYDGTQFSPSSINIKAGDYVFFKNKSTKDFWPASDPHPTHNGYPGFDAGKAVSAGGKYQFQFSKAGSWGFHDHLNPEAKGTVNVTR